MSEDRGKGPSANRITLLRDANGDGVAQERFVLPSGLLAKDGMLCVENTDAVMRCPFKTGQTTIDAEGEGERVRSS